MTNKVILKKIVQNNIHPIGEYCFICGNKVHRAQSIDGEVFICDSSKAHQSPRAFIFDSKSKSSIEHGELVHETVGALIIKIINDVPFFLLFLRKKFPFLYTIPAGHVEVNSTLSENMVREISEETALDILSIEHLWPTEQFRLYDPCRRGADYHRWSVFKVFTDGQPLLSDEGRIIGWYRVDEIKKLIAKKLLTLPSAYFLQKYWDEHQLL